MKILLKTMKIFKINISKKIIFIIAIAIIIVGFIVYKIFVFQNKDGFILEKVSKGTVLQEVSETGTVRATEDFNLGFKNSGRIAKINVKVGDSVEKGTELASLETNQLLVQLNQAQASLAVAEAQYNKLLAGSTPKEIKITENARDSSQNDLNGAYQDSLTTLDDAYLKIYNAYNLVGSLQNSYFNTSDQQGTKVANSKIAISDSLNLVKPFLDKAKLSLDHNDIDVALSKMEISLKNTSDGLKIIREACEEGIYYSRVSSTDKTALDNQRSYILTALTNINNAQQTISSDKIALQKAEDDLALKKAKPRQEDIDYYQAKVQEAQAQVVLLQTQIRDASLVSPIKGVVTKVDKKIGETVQTTELPISLISLDPFQIKVDIYEEDIVNVKVGNPVKINLVAFPDETLGGEVVSVNPAEKLIEGVVYYEVTINFIETKEGIKKGMTADITIETDKKENVLVISKSAIKEMNGKVIVQVLKDNIIQEREIEVGLIGSNNLVEVLSGLKEGDSVITGKK